MAMLKICRRGAMRGLLRADAAATLAAGYARLTLAVDISAMWQR